MNYAAILKRANELYAEAKIGKDVHFMAPEIRPEIRSDQVKSVLRALIEALIAQEAGR